MASGPFILPNNFRIVGIIPSLFLFLFGWIICKFNKKYVLYKFLNYNYYLKAYLSVEFLIETISNMNALKSKDENSKEN